jgi:hypothetical protein
MDEPWQLWRQFVEAAEREVVARAVVETALEDEYRSDVVARLRSDYAHELTPQGPTELLELAHAAMERAAGDSPSEKLYAAEVADVLRRYAGEHP